jgi:hypothetical protein
MQKGKRFSNEYESVWFLHLILIGNLNMKIDACIFLLLFTDFILLVYFIRPAITQNVSLSLSAARDRHPAIMVSLFDHFLAWFSSATDESLSPSMPAPSLTPSFVHSASAFPPPPIDYFQIAAASSASSSSSSPSSSSSSSPHSSTQHRRLRVDDGCLGALWLTCAPYADRMRDAWRIMGAQRPEWSQVPCEEYVIFSSFLLLQLVFTTRSELCSKYAVRSSVCFMS